MKPIIEVKNLKKRYRLGVIGTGSLAQDLKSYWARLRKKEDPNTMIGQENRKVGDSFMALNGVSFTVNKGETIGVIGSNGAGKSTLLKLITRVTGPTEGEIVLRGRIASMLEVGTGFNGEMTGRENIYMNGAILGMTKAEIDSKLDDIIAFSECADFIDTPVKRYSSGMYVKLAFAVAAHLDSEIMIMDEVLAVGDARFQKKCLDKMLDAATNDGKTILYVSHNMATVKQLCSRCIILNEGKIIFDGDVDKAIEIYLGAIGSDTIFGDLSDTPRFDGMKPTVKLMSYQIMNKEFSVFDNKEPVRMRFKIKAEKTVEKAMLRMIIKSSELVPVGTITSTQDINVVAGEEYTYDTEMDLSSLAPGKYIGSFTVFTVNDKIVDEYDSITDIFFFEIEETINNDAPWHSRWLGHNKFPDMKITQA